MSGIDSSDLIRYPIGKDGHYMVVHECQSHKCHGQFLVEMYVDALSQTAYYLFNPLAINSLKCPVCGICKVNDTPPLPVHTNLLKE